MGKSVQIPFIERVHASGCHSMGLLMAGGRGAVIKCLFCKTEIENPRTFKGEIVQKFCKKKCRYDYHNRVHREERLFGREIISTYKKFSKLGEND